MRAASATDTFLLTSCFQPQRPTITPRVTSPTVPMFSHINPMSFVVAHWPPQARFQLSGPPNAPPALQDSSTTFPKIQQPYHFANHPHPIGSSSTLATPRNHSIPPVPPPPPPPSLVSRRRRRPNNGSGSGESTVNVG